MDKVAYKYQYDAKSYSYTTREEPSHSSFSFTNIIGPFFGGCAVIAFGFLVFYLFLLLVSKIFKIDDNDNRTNNRNAKYSSNEKTHTADYSAGLSRSFNNTGAAKIKAVNNSYTINATEKRTINNDSNYISDSIFKDDSIKKITNKYEICNVKRRSEEWRRLRKGLVTGAAAYYLKDSSVEYAIRKSIDDSFVDYSGYWIERERRLEPTAIKLFSKKYNLIVRRVGFIKSLTYNKAGFSPDGVVFDKNGIIKTIVDHRSFGPSRHIACAKEIEEKVMYRIQFGLFVTGATDAYLVLYNPDLPKASNEFVVKHIYPNDKIFECFKRKFRDYKIKKST